MTLSPIPIDAPQPNTPPPPRALDYRHLNSFGLAGANLTFDSGVGASMSLPRRHLIYAECRDNQLIFRFPLHLVTVTLHPDSLLPRNLQTSASRDLLEQVLAGVVSVLYTTGPWAEVPPGSTFREVGKIAVVAPYQVEEVA